MACTNIELIKYPNLAKYIGEQLNKETFDYTEYILALDTPEFKKAVADADLNINRSPAKAFKLLKEVVAKRKNSLEEINKNIVDKSQGLFLSAVARNQALDYVARLSKKYIFEAMINNTRKPTFKDTILNIRNKELYSALYYRIASFGDNYTKRLNDAKANKTVVAEMRKIVEEINNNQLTNLFATFISIGDNAFVRDVLNRRSVAGVYSEQDADFDITENEEDGNFDEDGIVQGEVDDTDKFSLGWMNNIGEKTNFTQHVEEIIKLQLEMIPMLNSVTPTSSNGKLNWDINRNNELGIPNYLDAQELMNFLYLETDKTNIESFVNSIYDIATRFPGLEGLAYLYNQLHSNLNLASKYKMVFGMPVVKKKVIKVANGQAKVVVANEHIDGEKIIANMLSRNIKSITNKEIEAIETYLKKYPTRPKFINDDRSQSKTNVYNDILDIIKKIYSDIKDNEFKAYFYNSIDNIYTAYDFIKDSLGIAKTVDANKKLYNEKLKNKENLNDFKFVPSSVYNRFEEFAKSYRRFSKVKTSLNGRNVLGKQASYVINNSYLTNFNQILRSPKAVRSYIAQKTAGNDYNYDNILFESYSPTGSLIPGLFRRVGDKYVPTEYAADLVEVTLFDGSTNIDNAKASLYKDLSDGDYLLTSLIMYNSPEEIKTTIGDVKHTIIKRDFFIGIPSDAPKNFVVSIPTYSFEGLYKRVNEQPVIADAENKWNGITNTNIGDYKVKSKKTSHDIIYKLINREQGVNVPMDMSGIISDNKTGTRFIISDNHGNVYEIVGQFIKANEGYFVTNASIKQRLVSNEIPEFAGNNIFNEFKQYKIAEGKRNGTIYTTMDFNHPIVGAIRNIIQQEILDAYEEAHRTFKYNNEDNVEFNTNVEDKDFGKPIYIDNFDINKIYGSYGKGKGGVYKMENGRAVLLGNVYHLYELSTEHANLNKYYNLLGNGKVFDLLYGKGDNKVVVENGRLKLNPVQEQAINEAIEEFIVSYAKEAPVYLKQEYSSFIEGFENRNIAEFLINRMIAGVSMGTLFNGKTKYYKNLQAVLKRSKQVQAGGRNFGNIDLTSNSFSNNNKYDNIQITIKVNDTNKPVMGGDGNYIRMHSKFKGVTVNNTIKFSDKSTIDGLVEKLSHSNMTDEVFERTLKPFGYTKEDEKTDADPTIVNDAQSYITLDEWIRRTAAAGELNKYNDLIEALTNNTPVEDIDWTKFENKVQIQKNFYYDLHRETPTSPEVPRQIKNAEFVLIPKLIKGTELELIYNAMIKHGIDQINTAETSKAAEHNIIELWDNQGKLNLEAFETNVDKATQVYDYKYLYRQQDVPEHMVDTRNKAGIQILKKMLDNLPNEGVTGKLKQKFFDYYTSNIKQSFLDLAAELNLEIDNKGNLKMDENGVLDSFNIKVFLQKAKEQAIAQNANRVIVEMFDEAMEDFNRYPLFANNIGTKAENIINSLFNKGITRQTIEGWHAAQLSDFGFRKIAGNENKDKVSTDGKLKYQKKGEINGIPVYYAEIRLRRWSNTLYEEIKDENGKVIKRIPIPIENVDDNALTMIGYRIPTEGKQSIVVMKVVEFLDDAYGSTVVLPDEWVTQTGSDFDVDSVYAMTKHLYRTKVDKGTDTERTIIKANAEEDYTRDKKGYIRYVDNNINRAARKLLGQSKNELHSTIEQIDANEAALREKRNEDYKNAIIAGMNNLFKSNNKLWELAKENKDKELFAIAKAIGNKEKDTKSKIYINQVVSNLEKLIESGNIKNREAILNDIYSKYKELQQTFINQKEDIQLSFKNASEQVRAAIEFANNKQFEQAESFAKDYNLKTYVEWINDYNNNKADCLDKNTRNNVIVQNFIDILNNPAAFEENTGRSHFETLSKANEKWAEIYNKRVTNNKLDIAKTTEEKRIAGSNDFITQMKWKEAAGSGIKLKAISVNLDTMASISNVVHTELNTDIPIRYDNINEKNASKAYGKNYITSQKEFIIDTPHKAEMNFAYGDDKREDVKSLTTIDAIINGERTATTRYVRDGNIEFWTKLNEGDVVEFSNDNGKSIYVKITAPARQLSIYENAYEWSKKEGWSEEYFKNNVLPDIQDGAYQIEYEFIGEKKNYLDDINLVNHNKIGWSKNNKNIDNELITPYSSQTTAHILDVMKAGAIHNENIYTFNAFKLLLNLGVNYDTAVGFMYQPAMDMIVNKWKLTQSFNQTENEDVLYSAMKEAATDLGLNVEYETKSGIIRIFKTIYANYCNRKYGNIDNPYIYSKYNQDRLEGNMTEDEAKIHDFVVLLQFDKINKQAAIVNNYLRILTSDKFGAKQTFFQTDKIFRDIKDLLSDKKNQLYAYNKKGNKTNIINAVYPGIKKSPNNIDVANSSYPSLAAMLKYSSYTSTVVDANVFETDERNFADIVNNLSKFTKSGQIKEDESKAYKEYLIHKAYAGNNASPYLVMPITVDSKGNIMLQSFTGSLDEETKSNEILRIAGVKFTPNAENTLNINNIFNPTTEEINSFAKLTPAQKILWLKRNYVNNTIVNYIEVNDYNEASIETIGYANRTLSVRRGDMSDNALYDLFDRDFLSSNPILRLTAIDLVKYAYVIEGNKFKSNSISRIVSNLPVRDVSVGGLSIGTFSKAGVRNYNEIDPNSVASDELAIGFIRSNISTFRAPSFNYDKAIKQKPRNAIDKNYFLTDINIKPDGTIIVYTGNDKAVNKFIANKLIKYNKKPHTVLRINFGTYNNLYYGAFDEVKNIIYYPLNRLTNLDADRTIENSRYDLNNKLTSLESIIYSEKNEELINNYISYNIEYNLDNAKPITIGTNKIVFAMELANNDWYKNPIKVYRNANLKEYIVEITNDINNRKYIGIKITDKVKQDIIKNPITFSDYVDYINKYPNRDTTQDYIIIPKVTPNTDTKFSVLEDSDAVSNAIKHAMEKINRTAKRGDSASANLTSALRSANIDYGSTQSITTNKTVAVTNIAKYIKAAADDLINKTEAFITFNDEKIPVNDDRIIEQAIKDDVIREKFLTLANTMDAFKNRYKLFIDIYADELPDAEKEAVRLIQKAVNDISNNTKILQAKRKYTEAYLKANSTNPNVKEGLQSAFDIYGDTSKPDYWIQDIKFNRNPIIQAVYADTSVVLQQARIEGKKESIAFEKAFNELKSEAAKHGMSININNIIDETGKFIQPNSKAWYDKRDELKQKYIDAVAKTNDVNSVEALKANMIYKHFLVSTTIPRYKDVKIDTENGEDVIINYDMAMLLAERDMFRNDTTTKYYSEYRKLLVQQRDILSNMVGGVLNEDQEKAMSEIYIKINHLTSIKDENYENKTGDELKAAGALKNYIKRVAIIKEAYFDRVAKEGFEAQLKRNLDIIDKLEVRDANGNLSTPLSILMQNNDYKTARQWLRLNAIYNIDDDILNKVTIAYDMLKDNTVKDGIIALKIKDLDARDEYGIVDGTKFSEEDIAFVKREYLKNFNINKATGNPYSGIVRSQIDNNVIYKRSFYNNLTGNAKADEVVELIEKINKILEKAYDNENRILHTASNKLTIDDLKLLKYYIDQYKDLTKGTGSKSTAEFIEENCKTTYNEKAYKDDLRELAVRSDEYKTLWESIFNDVDYDGNIIPSRMFYGLIEPKKLEDWIDENRTRAIETINKYTVKTDTQYYRNEVARKREELSNEEFRKWYFDNHYYNPYSRKFEPLPIWTHTEYVYETGEKVKGYWKPRINQTDNIVDPNLINPEYDNYKNNYKVDSTYGDVSMDNDKYTKLNEYERKTIELFQTYINKYAFSDANKNFAKQGYLPNIAREKGFDTKDIFKEVASFFGFNADVPRDLSFTADEKITYDNDKDLPNPMLQAIMNKNMTPRKEVLTFPKEGETAAEFTIRRQQAIDYNRKVQEENDKLRAELIDKDWIDVMKTFIENSSRLAASRKIKNILYFADNALNNSEAYALNYKNELVLDKALSSEDEPEYKMVKNANSSLALRNHIRRVIFNEFKETTRPSLMKLGNIAQNVSGTKYMMLNVTGGIANVLTGQVNIGMERFARQYFNEKDYLVGQNLYLGGVISYISGMYSDKSTTLQDAVIKLANVVDFDRIAELTGKTLKGKLRNARGLLFAPQTMGEHYMQNSVLLTMMKNHKVITDENNNPIIVSREMYVRGADKQALFDIINDDMKNEYNKFVEMIKKDKSKRALYNMFRRDITEDFVRTYLTREQQREYIRKRNELTKQRNKDFDKEAVDVYSQFELVDGYASLKADALITYKEFARFVEKVKGVNKQIHGVYDKVGAAMIENKWWGGMVMQFHKHLYPGFKKRYRTKYYYDEQLENVQGASYTALARFLSIPLDTLPISEEKRTALESIQAYTKNLIDFYLNIGLNYSILPEYEQANIRKNLIELIYVGAAIAATIMVIAIGGDDDEIKESIGYNLALYTPDRLASETFAFNPLGFVSEAKKLWSSPVAFFQSPSDMLKLMNFSIRMLMDGTFEEEYQTGRYAGENKFKVILLRNIPLWRNIERIMTLPENNSYYKLGQNALSVVPVKGIAHWINPDVEVDE